MENQSSAPTRGVRGCAPAIGAVLCGLMALVALSAPFGTWALTPTGPERGVETPEGIAAVAAASLALALCVVRPFGILNNLTWFALAFALGAVMIVAPVWYEHANHVVGIGGGDHPQDFPISQNRADDAIKAGIVVAVAYSLILVPYGIVATVLASSRNRPPVNMTMGAPPESPQLNVPLPVLRPHERFVSAELVDVSGWIVASPRLARLTLTTERVVFCPPAAPYWYTIFAWMAGWLFGGQFDDGSRRIFRPPLGQPIQVELCDIEDLWENNPKYPERIRLCLNQGAQKLDSVEAKIGRHPIGWGYRLLNPTPFGRSVASLERQHEHCESLYATWRNAVAKPTSPD